MRNTQEEIFQAFQEAVTDKLYPYFSDLGFDYELPFKESADSIEKRFIKGKMEVYLNVSLHHLDYADGIYIVLKSESGIKYLLGEAQKQSETEVPVYSYFVDEVDAEMDRIISDFKKYFK